MKFFVKISLQIWPLTWQCRTGRSAQHSLAGNIMHTVNFMGQTFLCYVNNNSILCDCIRVRSYLAAYKGVMSFSYFFPLLLSFDFLLSNRVLGFYKLEGGLCSFSLDLQFPFSLPVFLGSCLAFWLKWKTKIFFLFCKRNPQRSERKIENLGGGLEVHSLGVLRVSLGRWKCYVLFIKEVLSNSGTIINYLYSQVEIRCYGHK